MSKMSAQHVERILALGKMSLRTVHDVNNQLTVLAMHADNLQEYLESVKADSSAEEDVKIILEGIGKMTSMLSHFPRFANYEESATQPLDLSLIADHAYHYLMSGASGNKPKISKDFSSGLPPIKADPIDVFSAIIERGERAKSVLDLRTCVENDSVCVKVTADGSTHTISFPKMSDVEIALFAA